jgi:hypothetical protein
VLLAQEEEVAAGQLKICKVFIREEVADAGMKLGWYLLQDGAGTTSR